MDPPTKRLKLTAPTDEQSQEQPAFGAKPRPGLLTLPIKLQNAIYEYALSYKVYKPKVIATEAGPKHVMRPADTYGHHGNSTRYDMALRRTCKKVYAGTCGLTIGKHSILSFKTMELTAMYLHVHSLPDHELKRVKEIQWELRRLRDEVPGEKGDYDNLPGEEEDLELYAKGLEMFPSLERIVVYMELWDDEIKPSEDKVREKIEMLKKASKKEFGVQFKFLTPDDDEW
ncbi:hypothetical protein N0V83_010831 [Neocucurbitaria cava]|uniref:Uncharacterized protein n=1 Tax=Neocucurbitaria cava TaxID=798079 RepID=A0A9W9CH53_9PLEO|nr:hypothetical protein N0V83_010831 [Neocucurbitaria cava]